MMSQVSDAALAHKDKECLGPIRDTMLQTTELASAMNDATRLSSQRQRGVRNGTVRVDTPLCLKRRPGVESPH